MTNFILHEVTSGESKLFYLEFCEESSIDLSKLLKREVNEKSLTSENEKSKEKEVYLTRQQTANFLQISLPTLHQ